MSSIVLAAGSSAYIPPPLVPSTHTHLHLPPPPSRVSPPPPRVPVCSAATSSGSEQCGIILGMAAVHYTLHKPRPRPSRQSQPNPQTTPHTTPTQVNPEPVGV